MNKTFYKNELCILYNKTGKNIYLLYKNLLYPSNILTIGVV